MSTLNVLCGICSEFYTNTDKIYVTRCGHVFHQQCLFHWLQVSHTCPQCRDSCLRHQCRRIYLNFEPLREDELKCEATSEISNKLSGYEWIAVDWEMDDELLKTFAFHFGTDENGNNIYCARGFHKGDIIPAYYSPSKRGVLAPWGFKSHLLTHNIEILDISCDGAAEYKWVHASNGDLPENALATGHTSYGEPLYTARAEHNGNLLYGKLHRQYKMAYVPYGDEELCKSQYEVLVRISKLQNSPSI
ncbi:uncharacterized protein LOC106090808 [Stomoxys calcitrans]|uniref:uncharacterized protein LOC106090808 n=1 Tax=Stomoxys calcitrans TaxID=35570 RepID=UPI0027E2C9D2|nr:uncharacterized protein LOC106090808 [Stomoxys calcitrans]